MEKLTLYFSDYFGVSQEALEEYGAFDISLITDLPLFIDPFLLFNSEKQAYQELHEGIIAYLKFLRDKSIQGIDPALLKSWFQFPEVKQTWLGFCQEGNSGRGLGPAFAEALYQSLRTFFSDFGEETITRGSHLEKLCLVKSGVGKDNVSDFTTNLIKHYLLEFTEAFARQHIDSEYLRNTAVEKTLFNYRTETWMSKTYELPVFNDTYVLLTPIDILTKDDTWINRDDLIDRFTRIPSAIGNAQLRAQINNYFQSILPEDPKKPDYQEAARKTIQTFPMVVDYYIKYKEDNGDVARSTSTIKVADSYQLYIQQSRELVEKLDKLTDFYHIVGKSKEASLEKILFLKDVIENKGGYRLFYLNNEPVRREADLQILFRLTWQGTVFDVSREVNDGGGQADFKISMGLDKTIVEFKLASNTKLENNLKKQVEIYQRASDAQTGYKVIMYFSEAEHKRVTDILGKLGLSEDPNIILIDARNDNKPSGSTA
jgi:hypothetical protein